MPAKMSAEDNRQYGKDLPPFRVNAAGIYDRYTVQKVYGIVLHNLSRFFEEVKGRLPKQDKKKHFFLFATYIHLANHKYLFQVVLMGPFGLRSFYKEENRCLVQQPYHHGLNFVFVHLYIFYIFFHL